MLRSHVDTGSKNAITGGRDRGVYVMDSIRRFRHVNVVLVTLITVGGFGCSSASGSSQTEDASAAGFSAREGVGGQGGPSASAGFPTSGGNQASSQEASRAAGGTTVDVRNSTLNLGGASSATTGDQGGAGANGGGSGGTDVLGSYGSFCSTVAATVCSSIAACCSMTRNECEVGYEKLCLRQWDLAAGATYFPGRAASCLPLLPSMFDGCEYQPAESEAYRNAERACEQVVVGNVSTGGNCSSDRYCATDASFASMCNADGGGSATCKAIPWIAVGAPCGQTVVGRCASGAFCDVTKQVCSPLRKTDEACDSPMQCLSYHCDSGTCKPATTAGICSNIAS
ncbi:MAG: hypothetical protein QM784_08275 [Polyangiaceae bacterium]